jgi:uncharacterized repeat protein (TIGR03803 family)
MGERMRRNLVVGARQRRPVGKWLIIAALLGLGAVSNARASVQSYNFQLLYSFTGGTDGATPLAGLIMDSQGNLYGTAYTGGSEGWGTVYKISTTGQQSVLYSFTGAADGGAPSGPLVMDSQGNLYGTTQYAGSSTCNAPFGCGTVFKLSPTGALSVLYTFTGVNGDGESPTAGVVLDANGNLYGVTPYGGATGNGMVFKVSPSGKETILYGFTGGNDGGLPDAGLTIDAQGDVYGTTAFDGFCSECGTVFEISAAGKETTLYNFHSSATDGGFPKGTLLLDGKGNVYGTTAGGGANGSGTVFKLDSSGNETVLYSFGATNSGDGQNPTGTLLMDASGNLYGTTQNGGTSSGGYQLGTVFELSSAGAESVLYGFPMNSTGCPNYPNGAYPIGGLVSDSKGDIYGTAEEGGSSADCSGNGSVFELSPAALSGKAQPSTTTMQFGGIPYGSTETLPLTVTNVGKGTLTVAPVLNAQSYVVAASNCGGGVASGSSCTLQIKFTPVSIATHNAILVLHTNGPTNPQIALNGSGTGLTPSTTYFLFGTIPSGSTKVQTLTITNHGMPGPITIATSITGYAYKVLTTAQNTCRAGITAGQSCALPIEFIPTFAATHIDFLTVTPSGGGAAFRVELKGVAD